MVSTLVNDSFEAVFQRCHDNRYRSQSDMADGDRCNTSLALMSHVSEVYITFFLYIRDVSNTRIKSI